MFKTNKKDIYFFKKYIDSDRLGPKPNRIGKF